MKKLSKKKLTLSKETLLNLKTATLENVHGGETRTVCTACPNTACALC
jgi:hypothetical protein